MFKFFYNPGKFYTTAERTHILLKQITLYVTTLSILYAFFLAPNDYQQGFAVKIMYIHVPSAWLCMFIYLLMTIYSISSFAFKAPFGFIFVKAVAPIGALFTLLCLITGSLWGKPMWGTWWVWDARLTSVLVLFIFYCIIIIINKSFDNIEVGEKITSVFVLLGSINLPIIKYSVDWWNTLHQPASISKLSSPSIEISILIPLIFTTIAFTLIFLFILSIRVRAEINIRKQIINE